MAVTIAELQQYLEPRLISLEKTIRDITEPIVKDIDRIRGAIDSLYDLDRDTRDRIGVVESDVKTLKDDKDDNKFAAELEQAKRNNRLMIISLAVGLPLSILITLLAGR